MIDKLISEITELYGICPFDLIKNNLIDCRAREKLPKNPKSIIVMLFPYRFEESRYENCNISKYACVKDYHIVINEALKPVISKLKSAYPDNEFVSFSDNSPIPEVSAALYAGLGVRGKNSLLINDIYGSYVFIGEIVTDLELKANTCKQINCIECGECIKKCPKNAISEIGINSVNCLSSITQAKGELSQENISIIKETGCLWGCDICQDVCPMNINIKINPFKAFENGFENRLRCDNNISERAYAWRGIRVIKRNYDIERMK